MRKILIMTSLLAFAFSCTKSPASKILVLYYSQTSNTKAENVSSRAVTGGTEYLFEARDIPREPDHAEQGHLIKVYVLCEEGKAPVFTQVLR